MNTELGHILMDFRGDRYGAAPIAIVLCKWSIEKLYSMNRMEESTLVVI